MDQDEWAHQCENDTDKIIALDVHIHRQVDMKVGSLGDGTTNDTDGIIAFNVHGKVDMKVGLSGKDSFVLTMPQSGLTKVNDDKEFLVSDSYFRLQQYQWISCANGV